MKASDSLDEAEALARLRGHERELDRQLEDARREATGSWRGSPCGRSG